MTLRASCSAKRTDGSAGHAVAGVAVCLPRRVGRNEHTGCIGRRVGCPVDRTTHPASVVLLTQLSNSSIDHFVPEVPTGDRPWPHGPIVEASLDDLHFIPGQLAPCHRALSAHGQVIEPSAAGQAGIPTPNCIRFRQSSTGAARQDPRHPV